MLDSAKGPQGQVLLLIKISPSIVVSTSNECSSLITHHRRSVGDALLLSARKADLRFLLDAIVSPQPPKSTTWLIVCR